MLNRPDKNDKKHLTSALGKSVALHIIVCSLVVFWILHEDTSITEQEQLLVEKVQEAEVAEQEEIIEAAEESAVEMAEEELKQELQELIQTEEALLDPQADMLKTAEALIDQGLNKASEEKSLIERSSENLSKLVSDIRESTLKELAKQRETTELAMIKDELTKHIQNQVAPDLQRRIEDEMELTLSRQIAQATKKSLLKSRQERLKGLLAKVKKVQTQTTAIANEERKFAHTIKPKSTDPKNLAKAHKEIAKKSKENDTALTALLAEIMSLTLKQDKPSKPIAESLKKDTAEKTAANQIKANKQADAKKTLLAHAALLHKRSNDINKLFHSLNSEIRTAKLDDIDKALVKKTVAAIESKSKARVREKIAKKIIPKVSGDIIKNIAKKLKLNKPTVKAALEKHVTDVLNNSLKSQQNPDVKFLTKNLRHNNIDKFGMPLKALSKAISKSQAPLSKLHKEQAALAKSIIRKSASADAAAQENISKKIQTERKVLEKTLSDVKKHSTVIP